MSKLWLYLAGAGLVAGGAVLGRWVDPTAGLAVGGAGMWLVGKAQKEWGHTRRKTDPGPPPAPEVK